MSAPRKPRPYRDGGEAMTASLPVVRVTEETMARVSLRAEAVGTSVSDYIRTAVMEHLDR